MKENVKSGKIHIKLTRVFFLRIEYKGDLDPDLLDLLQRLLEKNPDERITMPEIRVREKKKGQMFFPLQSKKGRKKINLIFHHVIIFILRYIHG